MAILASINSVLNDIQSSIIGFDYDFTPFDASEALDPPEALRAKLYVSFKGNRFAELQVTCWLKLPGRSTASIRLTHDAVTPGSRKYHSIEYEIGEIDKLQNDATSLIKNTWQYNVLELERRFEILTEGFGSPEGPLFQFAANRFSSRLCSRCKTILPDTNECPNK